MHATNQVEMIGHAVSHDICCDWTAIASDRTGGPLGAYSRQSSGFNMLLQHMVV